MRGRHSKYYSTSIVNIPRPVTGISLPLLSLIFGTSSGLTMVGLDELCRKRNTRTRGRASKRSARSRNASSIGVWSPSKAVTSSFPSRIRGRGNGDPASRYLTRNSKGRIENKAQDCRIDTRLDWPAFPNTNRGLPSCREGTCRGLKCTKDWDMCVYSAHGPAKQNNIFRRVHLQASDMLGHPNSSREREN